MNYLTKQEQFVLYVLVVLLVTGGAVKWYHAEHPPRTDIRQPVP